MEIRYSRKDRGFNAERVDEMSDQPKILEVLGIVFVILFTTGVFIGTSEAIRFFRNLHLRVKALETWRKEK